MAVIAQYPGTCPLCGGRYGPGTPIARASTREKWQHTECPDDPDAYAGEDYLSHKTVDDLSLRPGETVCETCFLVHPPGHCGE